MKRSGSSGNFNGYRQYSYSESFLDSIAVRDTSGNFIGVPIGINLDAEYDPPILSPIQRDNNLNHEWNTRWRENLNTTFTECRQWIINSPLWTREFYTRKEVWHTLFQHILMYMIHIGLISLFEIYFFFQVISRYEDAALLGLINGYITEFVAGCSSIGIPERDILSVLFHILVNQTEVYSASAVAYNKRIAWNGNLYETAWGYFSIVLHFNVAMIFINYRFKMGIHMGRVIIDNAMMILFLGIYEYIFFQTIILRYQSISSNELTANVVRQINQCLPASGWNSSSTSTTAFTPYNPNTNTYLPPQ